MPTTYPDNIYYTDASAVEPRATESAAQATSIQAALDILRSEMQFAGRMSGELVMWATNTAPAGWLLCRGQAVSRVAYSDLFAVIGTLYGTGNGTTTFNLPDFRGRVPVGLDTAQTEFDAPNKSGGAKTHTLTEAQMPAHTHQVPNSGPAGSIQAPQGSFYGIPNGYATSGSAGSGQAHNNLQPYRVINFIIKV